MKDYKKIINLALEEDLEPFGDLSSMLFDSDQSLVKASIVAKQPGFLAGSFLIREIVETYASELGWDSTKFQTLIKIPEAGAFASGTLIAEFYAPRKILLGAERTIMNFLQRLSGIATYTHSLVDLIKDYSVKLLDTRKTTPGLRSLEKYAFKTGGGTNHRFNLSDMVMLKENHLAAFGQNWIEAIKAIRARLDARTEICETKIEVEINQSNLAKLEQIISLKLPVDIVMLDNFSPGELLSIIQNLRTQSNLAIELSGGINHDNILDYAKTLPDYISTGSVYTKSHNIDLSFLIDA